MKSRQKFVSLLLAVGTAATLALAQSTETAKSVEQRLEELDQEIKILKRQRELEQESSTAKAKETPVLVAGKEGFGFKSADGNFAFKLRGYLQADSRFFLDDTAKTGTDTFLLRRVRPIVEGTLFKHFEFRMMPDFGGGTTVLQDAYIDWKPIPEAQLRFGKFKAPVGLERLQSGTDLIFIERGFPTGLVPNRDVGVQLSGTLWNGLFIYAGGIFNGVVDGGSADLDNGDGKDFAGRIFVHPFVKTEIEPLRGLGVGISGTWGDQAASLASPNLATYKSAGQQTIFRYRTGTPATVANTTLADGDRVRFSPQGYYYWGPFGVLGEYVDSGQEVKIAGAKDELHHQAWQVAGMWVVTGEKATFKGVSPKRNFDLKGGWGALELVARWNEFHADNDTYPTFANPANSVKDAQAWALGANWYLNKSVKVSFDYEQTTFDGGAAAGKDRRDEQVVFGRVQLAY